MADTSGAEALIRDARKRERAEVVREIVDALSKADIPRVGGPDYQVGYTHGIDEAVRVVKAYKVSNDA